MKDHPYAVSVSVCVALFDGQQYVGRQLRSILEQLEPQDEVIIIDDRSTDSSLAAVRKVRDGRIKIFTNRKNEGHVYTFLRAIRKSSGDVIMLADQDDIWAPGRRRVLVDEVVRSGFKALVTGRFRKIDESECFLDQRRYGPNTDMPKSLLRACFYFLKGPSDYYGCCMAFGFQLKPYILSLKIPIDVHDHWIVIVALLTGEVKNIEYTVTNRTIHANNLSSRKRGLVQKVLGRLLFLCAVATAAWQFKRYWFSKY